MKKKMLALLLAIVMVLSVFTACGKGGDAPVAAAPENEEVKEIEFWVAALMSADEMELSQEEWKLSQIIAQYEADNPGIKINLTLVEDQTTLHQQVKAFAAAGEGPDIVNLWTGTYISTLADVLLPLNEYIPEEDLEKITGWESLTDNLQDPSAGGNIIAYPAPSGKDLGVTLFNKEIIEECGLDFVNNPPKTPEEFEAAMATIQNAGYQPISAGDMGCAGLLSWGLGVWWAQNEGYERLTSNEMGTTKFSDDEGLIAMMEYATDWYAKGYINVDYATKTEDIVLSDFINGKCAMICTGNWNFTTLVENMGEEKLGILAFPDLNADVKYPGMILGGVGQSLCVMNYTKYPQECADFLSYLNNRENSITLATNRGMTPNRTDVTGEELGYTTDFWKLASQMTSDSTMWYEFAMTPSMVEVIYTDSVQVITGKMPLNDFLAALDARAAELQG